jgi:hypothetical protein
VIDFNSPSGPVMSSPRSRAALASSAIAARSLADTVDDDVLFFASLGIALMPVIVLVNSDQSSRRQLPACQPETPIGGQSRSREVSRPVDALHGRQ